MNVAVVVDRSGSMAFGRGGVKKIDYARMAAASIGYLAHVQRDAIGAITFDDEVRDYVAPSSRQGQFQRILHVPDMEDATYGPDVLTQPFGDESESEMHLRNLAAVAAVFYVRRNQLFRPSVPDRITNGWHRNGG